MDGATMKIKAFLKIDRMDPSGILCLRFWLEVFKSYETYILCDRETLLLTSVQIDYPHAKLIASDRAIISECCTTLKSSKKNIAAANLTGFKLSQNADAFWMIDADDTMFLTNEFDTLRSKFSRAEQLLVEKNFDGFSLDFYRNYNNSWTFGVCLLKSNLDYTKIREVSGDEMSNLGLAKNIDTAFDVLKRRGYWKLGNFVFSRMAFQHLYNNYPLMPQGIYYWNKGKLWDTPLQSDVISI